MKKYLLGLHRGLRLTYPRYRALQGFFDNDWQAAYQANINDWIEAGIDKKGIEKWFSQRQKINPDQEIKRIEDLQVEILTYDDPNFPVPLQHISNPPVILLVRGALEDSDWPSLSVVGSRRMTTYGQRAAEKILTPIAQQGITIVSGLAYGVDTLAHQIALQNDARTIAVLGNGIDEIYPKQNQNLAKKIIENGAIISEFLPGTEARPEYFPVRNRIVAGLSQGTLIIEAAAKSGSLITAQYAMDFGREVFAVPGEIFHHQAAGTNQLISDGAHLAQNGQSILDAMGIKAQKIPKLQIKLPETGIEHDILQHLKTGQARHIDEVIRDCGFPGTTVSSHLTLMEMKGWIQHLGGQRYVRRV